jgi:hypothetical protein
MKLFHVIGEGETIAAFQDQAMTSNSRQHQKIRKMLNNCPARSRRVNLNRLRSRLWLSGDSVHSTLASMNLTDCFNILLDDEDDLDLAGSAGDRQRDFVLMTVEHKVKTGGSDGEVP